MNPPPLGLGASFCHTNLFLDYTRFVDFLRTQFLGGRAFLGEVEGANVIKIHRRRSKISYLVYPDFDADPHPALGRCVRLSLRTRELHCDDYSASANPPFLHRKEAFLRPEHPLHARFARLTRQEEQHGLLDETVSIGTRSGWEARLRDAGFALRGHRVVRNTGRWRR